MGIGGSSAEGHPRHSLREDCLADFARTRDQRPDLELSCIRVREQIFAAIVSFKIECLDYFPNLSASIDNARLHEIFGEFGTILPCKVAADDGRKSRGYGFVQFDKQESAESAIEYLNGATVEGKQIYVGNFVKKSERVVLGSEAKYTNLYTKNLDQDITEELIELKFSRVWWNF